MNLITNIQEFCQGYFHMDECNEWKQPIYCLCETGNPICVHNSTLCFRATVRGLLVVRCNDKIVYAKKYENKFKGHTEENRHVEDLIVEDPVINNLLEKYRKNISLTLYIGYQPCHHSGGGRNLPYISNNKFHAKSCTEVLREWYRKLLYKYSDLRLNIRCLSIYRAHWTNRELYKTKSDTEIFYDKSLKAYEGILLLMSPIEVNDMEYFIDVSGMHQDDWYELLSFVASDVRKMISNSTWEYRYKYDTNIIKFLNEAREEAESQ